MATAHRVSRRVVGVAEYGQVGLPSDAYAAVKCGHGR